MSSNSTSVYFLINELCEQLYHEYCSNTHESCNANSIRKLKSKSYEILLKKSKEYNKVIDPIVNPIRELEIKSFALKIQSHNDYKKLKKCEHLKERLKFISSNKYFTEDSGKNVLILLLYLEDNLMDNEDNQENNLLIPGPFTLHSEFSKSNSYPKNTSQFPRNPELFQGLHTLLDFNNPYIPRFLFQNEMEIINLQYKCLDQPKPFIFQYLTNNISWEASHGNNFQLTCNFLQSKSTLFNFSFDDKQSNDTIITSENSKKSLISDSDSDEKRFSWEWEHLGHSDVRVSKPFAGEINTFLHLQANIEDAIGKKFVANIVSIESFMKDLKSLCVGVQSDSFEHDQYIAFNIKEHITIPGVSPNVLRNFVNDFLECGTCFKRLQIMIMKHNYKLMFDGFIFKAICSAVDEYLILFRQFVYSFEDKLLLNFFKRMKNMIKQITSLSCTLAIHPDSDINVKPPTGSQFLGFLYKEIMRATQKDLIMLLVYILKRCCHVYFKHLQKWIFYGRLDDPSNELFICFLNHYRKFTKYHYDKAYFVRKESVPGFFQGYEDQILLCGKLSMILKAFKPNHPLYELEYPSISVCLTFNEIETMENKCREYAEKAAVVCGKKLTVRDVFNKKIKTREEFLKLVSTKSHQNLQNWLVEKKSSAALEAAIKKNRLNEMQKQLEESKNRKIEERKENIALERKLLHDFELKFDENIVLENRNIQKSNDCFKKLTCLIETRKNIESELDATVLNIKTATDTPLTSSRTDFNSCIDDDDENDSNYDDCISPLLPDSIKQIDNLNKLSENNNEIKNTLIKKSVSDYFNSNNFESSIEFQQDKNSVLSTKLEHYFNSNDMQPTSINLKPDFLITKSQQTKLDSFNQEKKKMECNSKIKLPNSKDKLLKNSLSASNISELQKNRCKMMQSDTFAYFKHEPQRPNLNLSLNSERSKNRNKVLQCEYDILPLKTPTANTPMSTTSDSDQDVDNFNKSQDKQNANFENIKLNINDIDIENLNLDIPTATIQETPECGLSTAGILAKTGFNFSENNIKVTNFTEENEININTQSEMLEESSTYERCINLINSNFQCKPLCPYFQLNNYEMNKSSQNNKYKNEGIKNVIKKQQDLNSTLTEFLQKSIVMPLKIHLEILNNEIMRVFLKDLDIIGHFRSLRNFFFLMDGEFGCIICDGLISKLEINKSTPSELLNYQMLHSILDAAIGSSIFCNDKNSENLSFIVNDLPDNFDLTSPSVLSNLNLSYRIEWPLNLILNPETLEQYANIFKYLIKVRRISWVLEESFNMLKEIAKKNGNDMLLSPQYRRIQQIRHKFFHFVHSLKNHITSSALQASWKRFKDDLLTANSIEDIYRKHTNYIKKILFLCMLNRRSSEFYNTIENIFKVTLRFYRNLKAREWKKKDGDEYFTHSRYERIVADEIEFEKFIKYTIYLGNKIVKRGYQEEIGEFISLINYNYYYVVQN